MGIIWAIPVIASILILGSSGLSQNSFERSLTPIGVFEGIVDFKGGVFVQLVDATIVVAGGAGSGGGSSSGGGGGGGSKTPPRLGDASAASLGIGERGFGGTITQNDLQDQSSPHVVAIGEPLSLRIDLKENQGKNYIEYVALSLNPHPASTPFGVLDNPMPYKFVVRYDENTNGMYMDVIKTDSLTEEEWDNIPLGDEGAIFPMPDLIDLPNGDD